jgi:hypothetical protein
MMAPIIQGQMPHPVVTAVGRMLTPKHGEPQRCERIRIWRNPDGSVRETEWYELVLADDGMPHQ